MEGRHVKVILFDVAPDVNGEKCKVSETQSVVRCLANWLGAVITLFPFPFP